MLDTFAEDAMTLTPLQSSWTNKKEKSGTKPHKVTLFGVTMSNHHGVTDFKIHKALGPELSIKRNLDAVLFNVVVQSKLEFGLHSSHSFMSALKKSKGSAAKFKSNPGWQSVSLQVNWAEATSSAKTSPPPVPSTNKEDICFLFLCNNSQYEVCVCVCVYHSKRNSNTYIHISKWKKSRGRTFSSKENHLMQV